MDLEREYLASAGNGNQADVEIEDWDLYTFWLEKYAPETLRVVATQRFPVFQQNLRTIRAHNAEGRSWSMDATEFAAMTWDEFSAERLQRPQDCSATHTETSSSPSASDAPLPASKDWREKRVVTPVKNQGACGSCWTFSTSGVVESHEALATGRLVSLSEQQLVDCAGAFNNHGCNGGLPSQAMEYIHYAGGLEPEADYAYKGKDGACKFNPSKAAARILAVKNISQGDEAGLLTAVGTVGPVAIAFDCGPGGFQHYKAGVFDGENCPTSPQKVNHAVLAVGYGHDSKTGKDYWLVKNSWGPKWGMEGYFQILRGENKCGLADCASYPVMATAASSTATRQESIVV
jgi:cathepsin H